jgi:preprotein translocase subunit SecA
MSLFKKIFGDPNERVINKIRPIVDQINAFEEPLKKLNDEALRNKTQEFKNLLKSGKTLDDILPEAFAVIREASRRTIGLRHYDVQMIGGVVLHRGEIAEMKTGEGKTLVATLAAYLNALDGAGVHLITVNDYLARRDAVWMGKIYNFLGLKTSCIQHQQSFLYDESFEPEESEQQTASFIVKQKCLRPCSRQEAYAADITYGTNNEFGFDYLRDNMAYDLKQKSQRALHYAIIDEVDSILIDEARTPLIISAPAEESGTLYSKFAQIVPRLVENTDYNIDEKMKAATLTEDGLNKIEKILNMGNIYTEGGLQMVHHLEEALKAYALYRKDRDYVVQNGEVMIIDEFTGRILQGRRYSEGLHQAIEAKEGVEVQKESVTLATITFQNLFRMYKKLSGMTGTALTEAEEFSKIYKLEVTLIPTNKPVVRKDLPDRIYSTEKGKFMAAVNEIKSLHAKGQPVLVGTISIEKNEYLSSLLTQAGVPHRLLNAKQHEKEAQIIAQAGSVGAVTVATNMAGRGVDIILGGAPFDEAEYQKVVAAGGLFVLGTERHESRRIDNQLRGRSGRQGDPGTSQFYVSMEDDLMRVFGSERIKGLMQRMGLPEDMPIENRLVSNSIETAQKRVEGNNFDIRKHLVEYDDVMNKQREIVYARRDELLNLVKTDLTKIKDKVLAMIEDELEQVVSFHTAGVDGGDWNLKEIMEVASTIFPLNKELISEIESLTAENKDKLGEAETRTQIVEFLMKQAREIYDKLEAEVQTKSDRANAMRLIEKDLTLRAIDNLWVEHLDEMTALRAGIGLRGYAQQDPLIEYKRESKKMFMQLLNMIQQQVVYSVFKIGQAQKLADSVMQSSNISFSAPAKESQDKSSSISRLASDPFKTARRQESVTSKKVIDQDTGEKVGRNDPCPCGSGKKYKKCCG